MSMECSYNEEYFTYLLNKYGDMVYRVALTRTGNTSDAEDICQDTYEKLWLHLRKNYFESEEHIRSWLVTVAANAGVSKLREAFSGKRADLDFDIPFSENEFEKKELLDCIMRLDKKYSLVIYLHYYERLSTEEIASALKTNPSTVRTWLARGRQVLKKMLEPPVNT